MRGGGKKAMMRAKKRRINESRAEQQPRKKRNYKYTEAKGGPLHGMTICAGTGALLPSLMTSITHHHYSHHHYQHCNTLTPTENKKIK
jgi:hypothetical protein